MFRGFKISRISTGLLKVYGCVGVCVLIRSVCLKAVGLKTKSQFVAVAALMRPHPITYTVPKLI